MCNLWILCLWLLILSIKQGTKKVPSGRLGQVDSPSGQVPFTLSCLMGMESGKSSAK